jgi:hypothetical protein
LILEKNEAKAEQLTLTWIDKWNNFQLATSNNTLQLANIHSIASSDVKTTSFRLNARKDRNCFNIVYLDSKTRKCFA